MYKILTAILFLNLLPVSVFAAENPQVYFQSTATRVPPNGEFNVRVLVQTSEPINAIDIGIRYSSETLELVSLNNSKSIIDLWSGSVQRPPSGNTINLQGGSIDPFSGNGGEIVTLKFRAKKEGQANITFTKTDLYYADGKGTKAQTKPGGPLNVSVVEGAKLEPSILEGEGSDDKTPPVIETAKVASSPIDTSRLAVFNAVDNESGLKNTEIRFRRWFSWSDWQIATNPMRLPTTAWAFQVKAADNNGNTAEKTVYVPQAIPNIILPLLAILAGIITISVLRRRKRGI